MKTLQNTYERCDSVTQSVSGFDTILLFIENLSWWNQSERFHHRKFQFISTLSKFGNIRIAAVYVLDSSPVIGQHSVCVGDKAWDYLLLAAALNLRYCRQIQSELGGLEAGGVKVKEIYST